MLLATVAFIAALVSSPVLAADHVYTGRVEITEPVKVEDGDTFKGAPGSLVVLTGNGGFDLDGADHASFENLTIQNTSGRQAFRGDKCSDITIRRNTVVGDIFDKDISQIAIALTNCSDVKVAENTIRENYGGIYVKDSHNVEVKRNLLQYVAFGNIVVSGEDLLVEGNLIRDAGIRSARRPLNGGDGITSHGFKNLTIRRNIIEDANCYGTWTFNGGENLRYVENVVKGGMTYGLYLDNVRGGVVARNVFSRNRAGLSANGSRDVRIEHNQFLGNKVLISPDNDDLTLSHNVLAADFLTGPPVTIRDPKRVKAEHNIIMPAPDARTTTPEIRSLTFAFPAGEVFIKPLDVSEIAPELDPEDWRIDTYWTTPDGKKNRSGNLRLDSVAYNYGAQYLFGVLKPGEKRTIDAVLISRSGQTKDFSFVVKAEDQPG